MTAFDNCFQILLKKAVEWDEIERMPCRIKLLPIKKGAAAFHDFEEYERLVDVARAIEQRTYLIVLLGGEAGLRCGEMIALEWGDVDLTRGTVYPGFGLERTGRNAEGWTAACSARTIGPRSRGRSCRTG